MVLPFIGHSSLRMVLNDGFTNCRQFVLDGSGDTDDRGFTTQRQQPLCCRSRWHGETAEYRLASCAGVSTVRGGACSGEYY